MRARALLPVSSEAEQITRRLVAAAQQDEGCQQRRSLGGHRRTLWNIEGGGGENGVYSEAARLEFVAMCRQGSCVNCVLLDNVVVQFCEREREREF